MQDSGTAETPVRSKVAVLPPVLRAAGTSADCFHQQPGALARAGEGPAVDVWDPVTHPQFSAAVTHTTVWARERSSLVSGSEPVVSGVVSGPEGWGAVAGGFTSPANFDPSNYRFLVRAVRTDIGGLQTHLASLRGMIDEINGGADTFTTRYGGPPGSGRVIHASVMDERSSRPFMHANLALIFETVDGSHVVAAGADDLRATQDTNLRGRPPLDLVRALNQRYGIKTPDEVLAATVTYQPGQGRGGGGNNDVALYVPPAHDGTRLRVVGLAVFSRPEWANDNLYTPTAGKGALEALGVELGLPVVHLLELNGDRSPEAVKAMQALRT